jgi:hypothetical protein
MHTASKGKRKVPITFKCYEPKIWKRHEMKTIVLVIAGIVLLMAGTANATYTTDNSLYVGTTFATGINVIGGPASGSESGGSIDGSILNNVNLAYVYCLGLYQYVTVGQTYGSTTVSNDGTLVTTNPVTTITPVTNATAIAWLLYNYGQSGQGTNQSALQAAIWTEEFGSTVYVPSTAGALYSQYSYYLSQLNNAEIPGPLPNYVSDFLWMTPNGDPTIQALVGYEPTVGGSPTPIPGAA